MTRKTVGKTRTDLSLTEFPFISPGGKTAAPVEPGAQSEIGSETKKPNPVNGLVKGTPQRLTAQLLDALCADFDAHGADAIRSCREEQPQGYLRLIAGLLPKNIDINDNRLKDFSDAELDILIQLSQERVAGELAARERVAHSHNASGLEEGKEPAPR